MQILFTKLRLATKITVLLFLLGGCGTSVEDATPPLQKDNPANKWNQFKWDQAKWQ